MRGFTLLEMLTIVALLGLLTVMSAAALGPLNLRYRVTQATELAAEAVFQARGGAREAGRCYQVEVLSQGQVVDPGVAGDSLRVRRRTNADCESRPDPADLETVELIPMPSGVPVQLAAGKGMPVWRPNGRLQGAATQLLVGKTPQSLIQIQPQGPVCVTTPAAPGACP